MYHDDEDLHMCINCHSTIVGLENYLSHRNVACKSQHSVKGNVAPIPVLPPLDLPKAERMRPVPSAHGSTSREHLNFLNADFFFSSLELQSRRKDAVFEEVMGIEEVLEEEYEDRGDGVQGTVYVGGGKWGYEDYVPEREVWPGVMDRGREGLGTQREGEDKDMEHDGVEEIELGDKSKKETNEERGKNDKEESTSRGNGDHFPENIVSDKYSISDLSAKPEDALLRPSIMEIAQPVDAVDMCCLSGTAKDGVLNEFDITLDASNIEIDNLNEKGSDGSYRSSVAAPPSGHTRGKWVPGLASEGMRKSGNSVEYYCQPCNKNIRNRRSYEAHLSTSCHLKKLMINSGGINETSEGPRLRSRRLQLSKSKPIRNGSTGSLQPSKDEKELTNSNSYSQNYLMESLGIKRKVETTKDIMVESSIPKLKIVSESFEGKDDCLTTKLEDKDKKLETNVKMVPKKGKIKEIKREFLKVSKVSSKNVSVDPKMHEKNQNNGNLSDYNATHSDNDIYSYPFTKRNVKTSKTFLKNQSKQFEKVMHNNPIPLELNDASSGAVGIIRYPVVNLGHRCDSYEFQLELKSSKENIESESLQSSDKKLQDQMMLGLELIRTDHCLAHPEKPAKKYNLRKSIISKYDSSKQDAFEKTIYHESYVPIIEPAKTVRGESGDKNSFNPKVIEFDKESSRKPAKDNCLSKEVSSLCIEGEKGPLNPDRIQEAVAVSDAESVNLTEKNKEGDKQWNSAKGSEKINEDLIEKMTVATQTNVACYDLENLGKCEKSILDSHAVIDSALNSVNLEKSCMSKLLPLPIIESKRDYYAVKTSEKSKNLVDLCKPLPEPEKYSFMDVTSNKKSLKENEAHEGNNAVFHLPSVIAENGDSNIELTQHNSPISECTSLFIGGKKIDLSKCDPNILLIEMTNGGEFQTSGREIPSIHRQILTCNIPKNHLLFKTNQSYVLESDNIVASNIKNQVSQMQRDASIPISLKPVTATLLKIVNLQIQPPKVESEKTCYNLLESKESRIISENIHLDSYGNVQNKVVTGHVESMQLNDSPQNSSVLCETSKVSFILHDANNIKIPPTRMYSAQLCETPVKETVITDNVVTAKTSNFSIVYNKQKSERKYATNLHAISTSQKVLDENRCKSNGAMFEEVEVDASSKTDISLLKGEDNNNEKNSGSSYLSEKTSSSKTNAKNILTMRKVISNKSAAVKAPYLMWYVCGICSYKSERQWCMERHMTTHLPRSRCFTCKLCQQSFYNLYTLVQHQKRHEIKQWSCTKPNCLQSFATKKELHMHLNGPHNMAKIYKCSKCSYLGKSLQALDKHKKKHEGTEEMVQCNICSFYYKKSYLGRHKKIHDGQEVNCCPFCDYTSVYMNNLFRHVQSSHCYEKLFNCVFCPVNKVSQETDEVTEHSYCDDSQTFSTNALSKMIDHINLEHGEKKVFSFKHHGISEIRRIVLTLLGIYKSSSSKDTVLGGTKKRIIPEKISENVIPVENISDSCVTNKFSEDQNGRTDEFQPHFDRKASDNVNLSSSSMKNSSSEDACSNVTPVRSSKNNKFIEKKSDVRSNSNKITTIFDVTSFVKNDSASKSERQNEFLIINPNSPSFRSSSLPDEHSCCDSGDTNSVMNEKTLVNHSSLLRKNNPPQSEVFKFPVNEKICCISNVFTLAESNSDSVSEVNGVSEENVHECYDKVMSAGNNILDSADILWATEETIGGFGGSIIDGDVEVEDVKLEKDVHEYLGKDKHQNSDLLHQGNLVTSGNSTLIAGLLQNVNKTNISLTFPLAHSKSKRVLYSNCDTASRIRRKKRLRWTEVEIIKKCD